MTPAIAAMVLGGILLVAGWQNRNVLDVALGREGKIDKSTVNEAEMDFGAAGTANLNDIGSLTATPGGGSDPVSMVTAECNRIDALHRPYEWGGGHAGYRPNGNWDCSGAVSQVLHHAGLLTGPPRVSGAFMLYGEPGPGKFITIAANLGHVFMIVNGRVWQTSHQNPGGGPGWTDPRPTAGFVLRHPKGL